MTVNVRNVLFDMSTRSVVPQVVTDGEDRPDRIYAVGDLIHCKMGHHVCTVAHDIVRNQEITSDLFTLCDGQEPLRDGNPLTGQLGSLWPPQCSVCGEDWELRS